MRTCTVMIYTDGTISRYAVMRGKMIGRRFFDVGSAERLAVYEFTTQPDYKALTARHATTEAPAVYWQA